MRCVYKEGGYPHGQDGTKQCAQCAKLVWACTRGKGQEREWTRRVWRGQAAVARRVVSVTAWACQFEKEEVGRFAKVGLFCWEQCIEETRKTSEVKLQPTPLCCQCALGLVLGMISSRSTQSLTGLMQETTPTFTCLFSQFSCCAFPSPNFIAYISVIQ